MLKKIGMANTIMITIFLLLSLLLLSNGLLSVVSWLAIKLVLPVIGIVLFVVTLVRSVRKKISQTQRICSFAICVIYIFPVLITINAIPIAYPANIDFVKPAVTVQWPLREETMVAWGGDSIETNLPHAMWGSEKWAYDMVMEPHDTNT